MELHVDRDESVSAPVNRVPFVDSLHVNGNPEESPFIDPKKEPKSPAQMAFPDVKTAKNVHGTSPHSPLDPGNTSGISYLAAFANFFKCIVGVGCLALPVAFKDAGLIAGSVLIVVFGVLNGYCMQLLIKSAQFLSKQKNDGKRLDLGQVAFEACSCSFERFQPYSFALKILTNACIIGLQMGISSVFYVFVAVHVKEFFDYHTSLDMSTTTFMFLVFVPFVLVNCIKTLKLIAFISGVGNVIMFFSLIFIFQYLIQQDHFKLSTLPSIGTFDGLVTSAGTILYAFVGQALVIPLENKLKKPSQMLGWNGIISTGMAAIIVLYGCCGFLGYITYGQTVQGSITLNLPETTVYSIIKLLLTVVVFTGFAIQQYPVVEMTLPPVTKMMSQKFEFAQSQVTSTIIEFSYRILLVLICMAVAIAIPNLQDIIPFIGITTAMLLTFVFPPIFDSLIFFPLLFKKYQNCHDSEAKRSQIRNQIIFKLIQNVFLIFWGVFGCISGIRTTVRNLF